MFFLAKFPRLPSNWWQLFFRSKKTLVVNHLLLGDKNWLDYSFSLFEDLERWWLYRLYNWNIPYHFSCRKVMQYAWWCIDKFQSSSWLFTYRREEQNRSSLYSHHEGEKHISYRSHFLTRFFFNLPWSHSDPEFMIKAAWTTTFSQCQNEYWWLSFALILISPSLRPCHQKPEQKWRWRYQGGWFCLCLPSWWPGQLQQQQLELQQEQPRLQQVRPQLQLVQLRL